MFFWPTFDMPTAQNPFFMKNSLLIIALFMFTATGCFAQASLWAAATTGGTNGYGTILKGDSTGHNFTVVHNFAKTDSSNPDGSFPVGKMAVANNGVIYFVTELGGVADSCTICKFDPATNTFTMIYQFYANFYAGGVPTAGIIKGSDGLLYGATPNGGTLGSSGAGVIYSVDPATDTYTDLYNFSGTGTGPNSELLQASDGNFYGIVGQCTDSASSALLFSFNASTRQYTTLYNFNVSNVNYFQRAPALVQAPNGKIYGVYASAPYIGALNGPGMLFSYDIANNHFTDLHDFTNVEGLPQGGLVINNGNIYGETAGDSTHTIGQIYSYNIPNSLYHALAPLDSAIGVTPVGGLGMLGDELMGSFLAGGLYNNGSLFTFNLTSNTFTKLLDFDSPFTGAGPMCDILKYDFTTTGIAPVTETPIALYPNPANNMLYIQNAEPNTPYTITNVLGQVISHGTISGSLQPINISQLAAGTYLINNTRFVKE